MRARNLITAICLVILAVSVVCIVTGDDLKKTNQVEKIQNSAIDWANEYYYATGDGAMPSPEDEPNRGKAFLKAKNYAKMAAIANLYMAIDGTTISYKATGKDYMAVDVAIKQTIEGYVSNVEIVNEKRQTEGSDTIVSVTVRAPMYGSRGLAGALIKSNAGSSINAANVSVEKNNANITVSTAQGTGSFTSLIIDCTGKKIQRAISPKIRKLDGNEVWGTIKIDPIEVIERGIVAYATNMADAKDIERAGENPLIVKAVSRAGGSFYCDPVITDADAKTILTENKTSKFLDKQNVIFILDPVL